MTSVYFFRAETATNKQEKLHGRLVNRKTIFTKQIGSIK